jgi:hypothetical protein
MLLARPEANIPVMLLTERVMTRYAEVLVFCSALLLLPARASSQAEQEPAPPAAQPEDAPPTAPPADVPPPPAEAPAQPRVEAQAPAATPPPGQWVYTQQYGWVWMPYADRYTYVPADGYGQPYMYLYYPAYGWAWVAAPWVWGYGPWPYFSLGLAWNFGWYSHGWWRHPGRWHFAPGPFRRPVPGAVARPTPSRGAGSVGPAPRPGTGGGVVAPGVRPAPSRGSGGGGGGGGGGGAAPRRPR